jgi:isopenicillin-N epimerase
MTKLKNEFLLDPDIVFLNHGSFGATPKAVFAAYQNWQRELERQPVAFIARELLGLLERARGDLGATLGADPDDLVFTPNATFGVNLVARSLRLEDGDEILASDHEYGACDNVWTYTCAKTGARYKRQAIRLPVSSSEEVVEQLWEGVTGRTKVIFLSHITSPTALTLPVGRICQRAREAGITTIIDGAHAPGQIPVDLETIGADFYAGNCHKWMLSPKGAGFLHTRRDKQHLVEPLVVSWGWGQNAPYTTGSDYLDQLEWWGTKDPSAYLAVPAAIRFMEEHDWPDARRRCNTLLGEAIERINDLTGLASIYPDEERLYHQMAVVPLPNTENLKEFQSRLHSDYRIEVPCVEWQERQFVRVSVQAYNTREDLEALLKALEEMLPR